MWWMFVLGAHIFGSEKFRAPAQQNAKKSRWEKNAEHIFDATTVETKNGNS